MNSADDGLRVFIDSIPSLAWSASPDGSAQSFNRRWLDYTGLTANEAMGWGWKVAVHPDDLAKMLEVFRNALDSGRPFDVEGRLRRVDGEYRRFLFRGDPVLDESGKVVKWYGTNIDLEDRTRAEDALQASEESFRLIVDTIPGLVAVMNSGGGVESPPRSSCRNDRMLPAGVGMLSTSSPLAADRKTICPISLCTMAARSSGFGPGTITTPL